MKAIRLEVRKNEYNALKESPFEKIGVYKVEAPKETPKKKFEELFYDPIMEELHFSPYDLKRGSLNPKIVVEVSFLPGVTDNPGLCAKEALRFMGVDCSFVLSGAVYIFWKESGLTFSEIEKKAKEELGNELIQKMTISSYDEFEKRGRFKTVDLPKVCLEASSVVEVISLDLGAEELENLSLKRCLALSLDELNFIKDYFKKKDVHLFRKKRGLPQDPTDVELEILAQSWSEHCKHKIFSGHIDYKENLEGQEFKKLGAKKIEGLYETFIKKGTREIERERNLSWTKSVFTDNAGIVSFDNLVDLCFKVETHNSPSALDPYGGALTGILGVNRDILGCGNWQKRNLA